MHLRSISLKGFKSFPDRTRLEFTPGVSVVVGPNGSGKSNITDAVLWALGEQSPLAVRGQSMQDVIFAGAHGVQARSEAEVEVVLDNGDGAVDLPAGEIKRLASLAAASAGIDDAHLAITFVSGERIAELNATFRDRAEPTDVLSFPVDEGAPAAGPRELGDVFIAPDHTVDLREAVVHGVLHLVGMDHETDDGEMLVLQAEILGW